MKRSISLLGGILLTALPLVGLMTGCGGGNGGGVGIPTPTPSGTATPTATSVATNLGSAPVSFGNGQTGTLRLTRSGGAVTGTLVVNASPADAKTTKAFNFQIPAGTYVVTGSVNLSASPISFSILGNFPAPVGAFSINGTIPTTSANGTYTIAAGGQTVSGTYPKIGTSPTPVPTVTTPPVGTGGSFSGSIVSGSTANFGTAAFNPGTFAGTKATQSGITVLAVTATETSNVNNFRRGLVVTLSSAGGAFVKGQILPATSLTSPTLPNAHVTPVIAVTQPGQTAGSWGNFTVSSGTVTISDLTSTSITLVLNNVVVAGDIGSAKGTLTINGTLKSNYTPQ